jgi:hypothetical protein
MTSLTIDEALFPDLTGKVALITGTVFPRILESMAD